jgi:hypothetical protein
MFEANYPMGVGFLRGEDVNGGVVNNPKLMYRDWEYWAQRRARSMYDVFSNTNNILDLYNQKTEI